MPRADIYLAPLGPDRTNSRNIKTFASGWCLAPSLTLFDVARLLGALKGQNNVAQGNALGRCAARGNSPFLLALYGRHLPIAFARAAIVPPLQGGLNLSEPALGFPSPGRCPGLMCLAPLGPDRTSSRNIKKRKRGPGLRSIALFGVAPNAFAPKGPPQISPGQRPGWPVAKPSTEP
jgi:hypothetical protein